MSEERKMAPVQGYAAGIPWSLHMEAYSVYAKKYGKQEALITGWCRGGFGTGELDEFIPGWRERITELAEVKAQLAAKDREISRLSEVISSMRLKLHRLANPDNWCSTEHGEVWACGGHPCDEVRQALDPAAFAREAKEGASGG